jgi:hypothetical protein
MGCCASAGLSTQAKPSKQAATSKIFLRTEPVRFLENEPVRFLENEPVRFLENEPVRFLENEPVRFSEIEPARFLEIEPVRFVRIEPRRTKWPIKLRSLRLVARSRQDCANSSNIILIPSAAHRVTNL